jgi:hypothetical protein
MNPKSFVVVSDNLSHDKNTVVVYILHVLRSFLMTSNHVGSTSQHAVTEINIFSDGPSAQNKNRFMYALLDKLRTNLCLKRLTWSFFATSHGKGPVDGIGGTAKRIVCRSVLARRVESVLNAKDFAEVLMRSDTTIKVILSTPVDDNDILEALEVKQIFESAPKIPGIASDHHWECDANGLTRFRAAPTRSLTFELINLEDESSVHDPAAEPLSDLSGIEARDESSTTASQVTGPGPEETPAAPSTAVFSTGEIVKCILFDQKDRGKLYLGQILNVCGSEVQLKFLRPGRNGAYVFPNNDDISWEREENVSSIMQPTLDKRNHFVFPPSFTL